MKTFCTLIAYYNDLGYDLQKAAGRNDAFLNPNVYPADRDLAARSLKAVFVNNSNIDRWRAAQVGALFGIISAYKRPVYNYNKAAGQAALNNIRPTLNFTPF